MGSLAHLCDDTRADWGAQTPSGTVYTVALSEKDNFLTHHDGGTRLYLEGKPHSACLARVKAVQAFHMGPSRNWSDVGYNTLVCPHGRLIEGRGVLTVGAQCPGYNRSGIGSQLMTGGSDPLTDAMLNRQRRFYDDLTDLRGGSAQRKMGHRDGVSTDCPGDEAYAWVRAGMPHLGISGGGATAPIVRPKPTPTPTPTKGLEVDGLLGPATITAWQKVMGTTADGMISRPSNLIRAVQKRLNAKGARLSVDGLLGPNTTKALQKYLGTEQDGVISRPSQMVKALQRRLNTGKF